MLRFKKRKFALILLAAFSLTAIATPVLAQYEYKKHYKGPEDEEDIGVAMAADALVVRPLSFLALAGGTAVFLISWPFAALGGNSDVAAQKLFYEPAYYTFQRPLGEF